jgi:hypothetical protein
MKGLFPSACRIDLIIGSFQPIQIVILLTLKLVYDLVISQKFEHVRRVVSKHLESVFGVIHITLVQQTKMLKK